MPSISLGNARVFSLIIVAFLGVMVQILTAPFGLPAPPDTLAHGWDRFYTPLTQEAGFLGSLVGAIAVALLQYKEEVHQDEGFPLPLTPLCVAAYLLLPDLLPGQSAIGMIFLLGSQFAILVSIMLDMQPQLPGRQPYIMAVGYLIGLVLYMSSFTTAAAIPQSLLDPNQPALTWGTELLAVLVVPAFLIFAPTLKGAWHRPSQGFWFDDN